VKTIYCVTVTNIIELQIDRDATTWKIQVKLQRFEQRPFVGKLVARRE
jgi:hypothetical protein